MKIKTARLVKRVKIEGKWLERTPVVKSSGFVTEKVIHNNHPVHASGTFRLEWYDTNGKRQREQLGTSPLEAQHALAKKQNILEAQSKGVTVVEENKNRLTVEDAAETFLERQLKKAHKTRLARSRMLKLFRQSCPRHFMDQINRDDLLNFDTFLRKQGYSDRTVYNLFQGANTFMRHFEFIIKLKPGDWPTFDEKPAKKYTDEQLTKLFSKATHDEWLIFQFLLGSGGREGESSRLKWDEVSFSQNTVTFVSEEGSRTKNRKSRTVPLPDHVITALKEHRKVVKGRLVFPAENGGINGHLLRDLQHLALRSELNCGHCANVGEGGEKNCTEHAVCQQWGIHRFRKTFATKHLHKGTNIRQIQKWLGHHSLDVTIRYLADEEDDSAPVRQQVNSTFAEFARVAPQREVTIQ